MESMRLLAGPSIVFLIKYLIHHAQNKSTLSSTTRRTSQNVKNPFREKSIKMWSLNQMEQTGGEPDTIGFDTKSGKYIFCDCSSENSKSCRSVCHDRQGLK